MPTPSVPSAVVVVSRRPGSSAPKYASAQASASPPSATRVALPPNRSLHERGDLARRGAGVDECARCARRPAGSRSRATPRRARAPGEPLVASRRRRAPRLAAGPAPPTRYRRSPSTSAARLPPTRSGAMSTCTIVCSAPKRGAPPYITLALNAEPSTMTQSALGIARPPCTSDPRLHGCESATTPRARARSDDRDPGDLGEAADLLAGSGPEGAAAGNDDGSLGRGQRGDSRPDIRGRSRRGVLVRADIRPRRRPAARPCCTWRGSRSRGRRRQGSRSRARWSASAM